MPNRASRGTYRGKRMLDLAVVVVVTVPAVIIGIACALATKLSSSGPVFFRQDRIGRDGDVFRIWKFRTMLDGDNPVIPTRARITPVGQILRRTALDELPQLINVALGQMSLVGPRPTLPYQAERWTSRQRGRLGGRPGVTGLAQVQGRNELSWDERIEFDLEYLAAPSLALDLRILVRTVNTLVTGVGSDATASDDPIARVLDQAA